MFHSAAAAVLPALDLPTLARKGVRVAGEGGELSSDAGLLLFSLADQQLQVGVIPWYG